MCINYCSNSRLLFVSEEVYIALGSVYRSAKGAEIIVAKKLVIHQKYLSSGGRHDIGLVKLAMSARIGRWVFVICLLLCV